MNDPMDAVRTAILDVSDFPKPGVTFKDITPILEQPELFQCVIDQFVTRWRALKIDQIVGVESRGFILGAPVAAQLGVGLTLARKPGKLPRKTVSQSYDLEYGQDSLEIHADSFSPGKRVAMIDDVLATGGTAAACSQLILSAGGELTEIGFLMELGFLEGAKKLGEVPYHALIKY
jgi:adenine phosphoribosyltransferase